MQLTIGFLCGLGISLALIYPGFAETKNNAIANKLNLDNCRTELAQTQTIIQGMLMNK